MLILACGRRSRPLYGIGRRKYASDLGDFLSDLLKRVERVTSSLDAAHTTPQPLPSEKINRFKKNPKWSGPSNRESQPRKDVKKVNADSPQAKASRPIKAQKKYPTPDRASSARASTNSSPPPPPTDPPTIKISRHPLMNTFGSVYVEANTAQLQSSSPFQQAPRARNRPAFHQSRPQLDRLTSTRGPRRNQTSSPFSSSYTMKSKSREPKVASLRLSSKPVEPKLACTDLFYGKVASVNICTSSRVASLTMQKLEESKYPYLLPKSVISNLPPAGQNAFVAQANYNLEVDLKSLFSRFQDLVLGKPTRIEGISVLDPLSKSQIEIARNGSFSPSDKQKLCDMISGRLSPAQALLSAPWIKT